MRKYIHLLFIHSNEGFSNKICYSLKTLRKNEIVSVSKLVLPFVSSFSEWKTTIKRTKERSSSLRDMSSFIDTIFNKFLNLQKMFKIFLVRCISCSALLRKWLKNKKKKRSLIWREPTKHIDNCFFHLTPSLKAKKDC